jgi:predicted glycosyltransferase
MDIGLLKEKRAHRSQSNVWHREGRHHVRLGGGISLQPSRPHAVSSKLKPKILLYSHDTFGLGNIRRTLLLAEELRNQYEGAAILIVTGSPMIQSFRIPAGVDYVKLPCLDRTESERYEPRFLQQCADEVKQTRSAILRNTVLGFGPDLMIVDKRAGGVDGELLPALRAMRESGSIGKLVLGVRDILDAPERTRANLTNNGSFDIIEEFYDEVWIYGSRCVFDAVKEYDFPDSVARITHFCGYLKRPTAPPARDEGPPHVLVTTGGGGDGLALIGTYLEGLAGLPRSTALRTTVVFGPQMSPAFREGLLQQFGYLADVSFLDFEADLAERYAAADVVVSLAGYNTVCELLSFAQRAILVPRAEPVQEQLIRARLLANKGYFDLIEPEDLKPEILISRVLSALKPTPTVVPPLDLDGLPRVVQRTAELLGQYV